jgi:hypothetical protein
MQKPKLQNGLPIERLNPAPLSTAPQFFAYIPFGMLPTTSSIDIDSNLKGLDRVNSKCIKCKQVRKNGSPTREKCIHGEF